MKKTTVPATVEAKALVQIKDAYRLSASQTERLAKNLTVKIYKKDEIIVDQDERATLIYLLLSGVVRVSYNAYERQTIVSLLSPSEFFGLDSLAPDVRHPFRCDAFDTSAVAFIRPHAFVETLLGVRYDNFFPAFAATLHSSRESYIRCIRGIGLDVRRRIALELADLADRFGSAEARGVLIKLALSHETLAGIVGASRQQVTQYLNEFDRERIIVREGRRIIVNPKSLHKIVESGP